MSMEHWWNDSDWGKLKYLEKTRHSPISTTIKPTQTGLGLNPGLCSEKVVTNHLRHGTSPQRKLKMDEYVSAKCTHLHLPVTFMNTDIFTTSKQDKMAK
jgi:hypothetical protein